MAAEPSIAVHSATVQPIFNGGHRGQSIANFRMFGSVGSAEGEEHNYAAGLDSVPHILAAHAPSQWPTLPCDIERRIIAIIVRPLTVHDCLLNNCELSSTSIHV